MSAPVQNQSVKPTAPWAAEELSKYAPRRHHSDGGSDGSESLAETVPLPSHLIARPNALMAHPAVNDLADDQFRRGLLSPTLDPVVMPLPPEDNDKSFRLGGLIKVGAAIGIAASVAMIVVNVVNFEDTGSPQGKSALMPTAVLESLAQIDPAEAKIAQEDTPSATSAIIAAASPDTTARTWPPTSSPSPAPNNSNALALATPAPAPAAVPVRTTVPLPREEVDALMKRGRALLAAGDVASARLILTRLSDAGNADASLLLARTYDPIELTKLRLLGAIPDAAKARAWYLRAAEQGSLEASRRIQQSAVR